MLSRWPIRKKFIAGVVVLLVMLTVLSFSSFRGVYSYRGLVKGISHRANELPLAIKLTQDVSQLRTTIMQARQSHKARPGLEADDPLPTWDRPQQRRKFQEDLDQVRETLRIYQQRLESNDRVDAADRRIYENQREWEIVHNVEKTLDNIQLHYSADDWFLGSAHIENVETQLEYLQNQTDPLPNFLQERMQSLAENVRVQYRTWIILTWVTSACALFLLIISVRLFYHWVFRPLQILIVDSQRVARGDFNYQIRLPSQDEMADLAAAMNHMTARFREIRDDLDEKVRLRTKEVLRSEQLASVGFLAAGVAHEINNPLASIALCAESLEERLHDIIQIDDALPDEEHNEEIVVLKTYLRMIQDEAFRCKTITERLLDFSRLGDVQMQETDLDELVRGVISMVRHIGKYKQKKIEYRADPAVSAAVNAQEMKQVVLNLLTNALDSLEPGGCVDVELSLQHDHVAMSFVDDGCGMSREVLDQVFQPFFTRRRDGQGTGLGLSISYRIIEEHGGIIEVQSEGPGCGSRFVVRLPLQPSQIEETRHHYHAA